MFKASVPTVAAAVANVPPKTSAPLPTLEKTPPNFEAKLSPFFPVSSIALLAFSLSIKIEPYKLKILANFNTS